MKKAELRFAIIGGGVAGLTTAIALQKAGFKFVLFESESEIKGAGSGLGLGANAMQCFAKLGIRDKVVANGRLFPAFSIKDHKGNLINRTFNLNPEGTPGLDNFTIHRAALHKVLRDELPAELLVSSSQVICCNQTDAGVELRFANGRAETFDYAIAADGIHSAIRKQYLPESKLRYAGYTCWRGISDNVSLEIDETSEIWGPKGRFGIVPLNDGNLYWFACINAHFRDKRFENFSSQNLANRFSDYPKEVREIIQATPSGKILHNDISDLEPVSRFVFDRVVLIGDAAHATTPNLGQGACQAIEDAVILTAELTKNENPVEAFKAFEKRRKKRVHKIVNDSAQLGKLAQIESKPAIRVRNFLIRYSPEFLKERQFRFLNSVNLD